MTLDLANILGSIESSKQGNHLPVIIILASQTCAMTNKYLSLFCASFKRSAYQLFVSFEVPIFQQIRKSFMNTEFVLKIIDAK